MIELTSNISLTLITKILVIFHIFYLIVYKSYTKNRAIIVIRHICDKLFQKNERNDICHTRTFLPWKTNISPTSGGQFIGEAFGRDFVEVVARLPVFTHRIPFPRTSSFCSPHSVARMVNHCARMTLGRQCLIRAPLLRGPLH